MARILIGTATLQPGGGIAKVARLTARVLGEAGHDVRIVTYLDGVQQDGTFGAGGSRARFLLKTQWEGWRGDLCIYDSASLARVHPHWPRRPHVVWLHGAEAWEALRPSGLTALRRADRVLAVSQHSLLRFKALHGSLPAARVCSPGTEEDTPPQTATTAKEPLVLMVGRIDAEENYKGHDLTVDIWPSVVAALPEARLTIVGTGSGLPALQARIAASPVAASIDALGFVPSRALDDLWARAGLFAMPSRGEGFGLVYVEAMRHGVPVITSTQDAGQEVNVDGVTGACVDLSKPGTLAAAIIRLLGDPVLRTKMGRAAQARWLDQYRYSALRSRLLPLLEDLLPAKLPVSPQSGRGRDNHDGYSGEQDPQRRFQAG